MKIQSLGLLFAVIFAVSCTNKSDQTATSAQSKAQSELKVGLVLDKGGKDDKSFNQAAFTGSTKAVQDFGIQLKDVEVPTDDGFEVALRTFAEREYPLVIAVGFAQADAVKKVAPQFPKTHFALVDSVVEGPNVASLMFAEHEGSFLVGYTAGLMTKTGKVGFIGGMDIDLIRRFHMGYEAGIKAARPDAELITNYVGVNGSAWANPSRGKELALGQYARKADIIFHAAGATGAGVFDAAEEKNLFAIGVDSNQNMIKPGRIITSMLKRVDVAVYDIIKAEKEGQFKAGLQSFGLANNGIDYAVDEHNAKLIEPYKAKIEEMKKKIIDGEIKVPDYYKTGKPTKQTASAAQ